MMMIRPMRILLVITCGLSIQTTCAFLHESPSSSSRRRSWIPIRATKDDTTSTTAAAVSTNPATTCPLLDPSVAGKFKILTCSSTACTKKRKELFQDELSTFTAMYCLKEENNAPTVQIEESPCLGNCKMAPCVGIEHDDYEGLVSLDGMTDSEFQARVFHGIAFDDDADRVWSSVENAIRIMAEQEENKEEEEEEA